MQTSFPFKRTHGKVAFIHHSLVLRPSFTYIYSRTNVSCRIHYALAPDGAPRYLLPSSDTIGTNADIDIVAFFIGGALFAKRGTHTKPAACSSSLTLLNLAGSRQRPTIAPPEPENLAAELCFCAMEIICRLSWPMTSSPYNDLRNAKFSSIRSANVACW